MKTIQIPTTSNPFIVNINNTAYQYRAGETAEVPDEVAEAIEDALEMEPKPKRYPSKLAKLAEGSLQEITAEDLAGISVLASCAFYKNHGLKSITIPNNIREIGEDALGWCNNLQRVYLPEVPPMLAVDTFVGLKTTCVFYCKTQVSLEAYKVATNWSTLSGTNSFVVEA